MSEATIFIAALDTPTEAGRAAFLAQACAGDERRRRVEALLRAHAEPDDLEPVMGRSIASGILGALAAVAVTILAWTGQALFDLEIPRIGFYVVTLLGAAFGGWAGSRGGSVTRWTGGLALLVGAIGFAGGFFGPLLFQKDSPQGPLFGIFATGPYGAILGAIIGLVIAVIRQRQPRQRSKTPASISRRK